MPQPQTITVIYDGEVLRPETPLELRVNARYRVTIVPTVVEEHEADSNKEGDLWDLLDELAGTIEMPPDWAAEHDHYLYGTPKRGATGNG